jgi:acyl carrier protein
MRNDVAERLKKIVVDQVGYDLPLDHIHESTSLYGKGLGLSSLDMVGLIVRLEDEFNIFFEADEVMPSVQTFGTLVGAVCQKLAANH